MIRPHTDLRRALATAGFLTLAAGSVQATTLAYWRFEEGAADAQAPAGTAGYNYDQMTFADSSGSGNELEVWDEGGAGFVYRTDVPFGTVPQGGLTNNFSLQNSGGAPASFTDPAGPLGSAELAQWTIEVSWKPEESNGFRTVVGRDANGVNSADGNLAALYLGATNTDALKIQFTDEDGFNHVAQTADGFVQGWVFGTDDPANFDWYNIAAVSDGITLSLYAGIGSLGYSLVASADLTAGGSTNTALTDGINSVGGVAGAGDWTAGDWSVGRGLYGGGHVDRAWGLIDEVRISDEALTPDQFLFVPEPSTALLGAFGLLGFLRRRR